MPPCFAYDPAAASKRARQAETTETSGTPSPSANAAALALRAASAAAPIHAVPISAIPPTLLPLRTKPSPFVPGRGRDREEPPCLRRHFLVALGLRAAPTCPCTSSPRSS
ncbi:unnamed protein product [Urochloa humidicola]